MFCILQHNKESCIQFACVSVFVLTELIIIAKSHGTWKSLELLTLVLLYLNENYIAEHSLLICTITFKLFQVACLLCFADDSERTKTQIYTNWSNSLSQFVFKFKPDALALSRKSLTQKGSITKRIIPLPSLCSLHLYLLSSGLVRSG